MSELYPTPTRLALLRDVARCEVYLSNDGNDYHHYADSFWPRKVNAAIAEQERAGWVELGEPDFGTRYWHITDAGRAVLDTHGSQP